MAAEEDYCSTTNGSSFHILALYKFVTPKISQEQLKSLQQEIETECRQAKARGCVLVAPEGINGTICYPENDNLLQFFLEKFPGLRHRLSLDDRPVYARLKVKLKPEIVTLRAAACNDDDDDGTCHVDIDPTRRVGKYVRPGPEWNKLLQDPECLVIDTRNDYEVRVGTFRNAINPHTRTFNEFPDFLKQQQQLQQASQQSQRFKSVAMFCTGGIRCEKATSLALVSNVFPRDTPIYHLEGGILAYLDQVPPEDSLFEGECYVFDQRIAVTHGLLPTRTYTQCHACRNPLRPQDKERDDFQEGMSCRYCIQDMNDKKRKRFGERQKQVELSQRLGTPHIYDPKERVDNVVTNH